MKKPISILMAGIIAASTAGNALDASAYADTWYSAASRFCVDRGYMEAGGNGAFEPDKPITRGDLALMIHALDNSPTYEYDDPFVDPYYPFDDLERGGRYTEAAVWAEGVGIFAGCGDGLFNGEAPITREQTAVVLRAFAKYRQYNLTARADLNVFPDAAKVSEWARGAVEWCVACGLIAGVKSDGETTISPRVPVTRAQIAVMLRSFRVNIIDAALSAASAGSYFLMGGNGNGQIDDSPVFDEILRVCRADNPKCLYIGFAGGSPDGGIGQVYSAFGDRIYSCDYLNYDDFDDPEAGRKKILDADIIFVGGGSTVKLVAQLRKMGAISVLREAAANGTVMSGSSAGAICFCESGLSQVDMAHMRVDAVGCVDILCCPHSFTDKARYELIEKELANTPYMKAFAIDGAAIEITGGQFRAIFFAESGTMARLCEYRSGEYVVSDIGTEWRPISELSG